MGCGALRPNPRRLGAAFLLRWCKPDSTLFIVQSKTFTTQETLTLAASGFQRWLADRPLDPQAAGPAPGSRSPPRQVSAAQGYAERGGFWDWVGGRYSVWSASIGRWSDHRSARPTSRLPDRRPRDGPPFLEAAPERNLRC